MNREYQWIIDDIENSECYKFLELQIIHLHHGGCEMYLPIRDHVLNRFGKLDQKVIYTICDVASFAVTCTLVPAEDIPVHCGMNISILSMGLSPGGLKIVARAIETEVDGFIESEISNDHGELVAVGSIRFKGLKQDKTLGIPIIR